MIQELETEVSNLKQTNFILEERIKLFEASKKKDINDQYITIQTKHSSSRTCPAPACGGPCLGQPCTTTPNCPDRATTPNQSSPPPTEIASLVQILHSLTDEVKEIKIHLLKHNVPVPMQSSSSTTLRSPSFQLQSANSVNDPDSDSSINTIDDEIPEILIENPLN